MSDDPYMALGAWLESSHLGWAVWFCGGRLVAQYDSMYTVYDRETGAQLYHGVNDEAVLSAVGLGPDQFGEAYEAAY